jgi:hypothetical protein
VRKKSWRQHDEKAVAKALRTYVRANSLFKRARLSTNIKFTLCKTLIRSVMTYVYPTCEYAADDYVLKFQCLQKRVIRATGNLDGCTPVHELRVDIKTPYVYDDTTKLSRTEAELILNHANPIVRGIGQSKSMHRKCRRQTWRRQSLWPINWLECSLGMVK